MKKLFVISPRYELARLFAHANHIHHDHLVYVRGVQDVVGCYPEHVYVVGHPNPQIVVEVRRRVETSGGRMVFCEPFDCVVAAVGGDGTVDLSDRPEAH